jgi:tRNA (guanine37-N1)-methyltransferase
MAKITFDVITLFPNFFDSPLETSLLKKGIEKNLLNINLHNLRGWGKGRNKQVDDRPFGGGPGMVLKPDVLTSCLKGILKKGTTKPYVIVLDPAGTKYNQEKAAALSKKRRLVLVCGHYEGIDERFKKLYADEEISIGDYILSGGETAALVMIETISRQIPGFLGKDESSVSESFSKVDIGDRKVPLLDYPTYTRPESFENQKVPEVLLSGNHGKIAKWRKEKAIERTKSKRPDLLAEVTI